MATPTNYSACVHIPVLNFSRDKIFVVNVHPAKTAKIFNLENFRLHGSIAQTNELHAVPDYSMTVITCLSPYDILGQEPTLCLWHIANNVI